MPWAVAAAIVVGAGISYLSSREQAEAQQGMANAQLGQARADRAAAMGAALPSAMELQAQAEQMRAAEMALARQQKMLDAVDPALIEAGKQALSLLQGHDAQVISPLKSELTFQRQQLVNSLREQMGPGAETSSAGIQALGNFDRQAATLVSQKQQEAVQLLLNSAHTSEQTSWQGQAVDAFGNIAKTSRQQSQDMVSAINHTPITPYAGAPFVGDSMNAAANKNFGDTLTKAGMAAGTMMAMQGGNNSGGGGGGSGLTYVNNSPTYASGASTNLGQPMDYPVGYNQYNGYNYSGGTAPYAGASFADMRNR